MARNGELIETGYAVVGEIGAAVAPFITALETALTQAGFVPVEEPETAGLVVDVVDPERPRPFRRKSRGTFVAALTALEHEPADGLKETYPLLVRALANVVLCYLPSAGTVLFTTMERGHYAIEGDGGLASLATAVVERLTPLARARLVIDNEFRADLEPELWTGDDRTEEIKAAGRRLAELDLLPAPFPIEELLDERDLRHVARLYGIGGLSYGNLSARKDERRFWMSASGVDKSRLEEPGRDILLVSGYDEEAGRMILSVPPGVEPRRVSVDAIEHWMIYRRHPGVGAILHVHAWMEGISATEVNYPVRQRGAGRQRRRPGRCGARSDACRRRPAQPRHHGDRRQPRRDPRPDRAAGDAAGADDVTTLVTGATGFLGRHLVAALVARGDDVRALVREGTDAVSLEAQGVEVVRGDLAGRAPLQRATDGCGLVFHLAGIVSHERRDLERMRTVNVEGTRRLLEVLEPSIRVVHVSSVAAIGTVESPDRAADESAAFDDAAARLPYAATKHAAEQLALAAAEAGADVVVANPGFLLGPGDIHRVSTWPVDAYLAGKLRFTTRGGLCYVDARDVAAGLVMLAERGRSGERTILAGRAGNLAWADFFARIAAVSGRRRLTVPLPARLAAAAAGIVRRPVSADEVRAAAHWWFYDGAKAERELGFRTRPLDETLADTIADHRK